MLHSPRAVVVNEETPSPRTYQYVLFNNMRKQNQWYDDVLGSKSRSDRTAPNMQQVIHADMERMKTNKVYDRKLNRDLNGPKGLNWQCKQELQRLRSDERGIERELLRLNRDLAKLSILPSISRSPSLQNQSTRLSIIAEENPTTPVLLDKPRASVQRSSSMGPHRVLGPIKRSPSMRIAPSIPKPTFQRLIAKTSDDRQQHHANVIEQQKRLVEQRLKQFLH